MTKFEVTAVQSKTKKSKKKAEVIHMSLDDQQCFSQALLNPPEPAPAMLRAFAKRDKLTIK